MNQTTQTLTPSLQKGDYARFNAKVNQQTRFVFRLLGWDGESPMEIVGFGEDKDGPFAYLAHKDAKGDKSDFEIGLEYLSKAPNPNHH